MLVVARDLNDVDDLDDDLDLDYDDVRVPGSSKGSTETIKLLFHAGKPQVRVIICTFSNLIMNLMSFERILLQSSKLY